MASLALAAAAVVVLLVFIAGLLRGIPLQQMFLTSISLAVAAVPEGLPALITISLSLGAARMVRNNALIRRLPAVETLGSVTVICSDKTGTLTRNEMTVTDIALPRHEALVISGIGYNVEGDIRPADGEPLTAETLRPDEPRADRDVIRVIQAISLSTNAYLEAVDDGAALNVVGDTTEGALLVAARKAGITREELERELPRVAELPFSSERKAMTTVHEVCGELEAAIFPNTPFIAITKGAPDQLLDWATRETTPQGSQALEEGRRAIWRETIDDMAQQGLRVIGVAWRALDTVPETLTPEIERDLSLLALVGIVDPARPEARMAVETARGAGLRSIMITGDHALTAQAIARDLGILGPDGEAVTGSELDGMDDGQLREKLGLSSTFARVSPTHKLRLVQVLQAQGETVAMTGDGVNDAPALKQADIGIAMGITGTDVSKGAAEMVLTDDNFASIVRAVEEGPRHLRQHSQIRALPAQLQRRRNPGDVRRPDHRSQDSAAGHPDPLGQSRHRRPAGHCPRFRTGRRGRHAPQTAGARRKHSRRRHRQIHPAHRRTDRHFDPGELRLGLHLARYAALQRDSRPRIPARVRPATDC